MNRELTKEEVDYVASIIMTWINNEIAREKTH